MKLDISNWKNFKLTEIFESFEKGKCSNAPDLEDGNEIPYIGAKKEENGVMKWVNKDGSLITKGNCICFICQGEGSNGYNNYFESETIQSTSNTVAYSKHLNKYNGIFLVAILDLERPKWSFGRGRAPKLKDTIIKLPSKNGNPDWERMTNEIKDIYIPLWESLQTNVKKRKLNMDIKEWQYFSVGCLFDVKGTKTTSINEVESNPGNNNYVTTQATNNGVLLLTSLMSETGNVITIDSATIGFVSYQEHDFVASDHVEKLIPKFQIDKYIALFLATILNGEQYRYGYGRKRNQINIRNDRIKLPSKNNAPNWEYMRSYIKSLQNSDKI